MTAVIDPAINLIPAAPDDGPALDAFMARCSARSRYARFFAPVRELPIAYRAGVLAGDPARHDAIVARTYRGDGEVIGLASLVANPDAAELGVLVADDWQGRGIGTALVDELVARARRRGVRYLRAAVLPGSARLLRWLGRSLPMERSEWDGASASGLFRLL
jgi:GNAT superfamily N-acetyltransferase